MLIIKSFLCCIIAVGLIRFGYCLAKKKFYRLLESILHEINGAEGSMSHDNWRLQRARNLILKEVTDGV